MRSIPLSRGKFAIVDDQDYEELMKYKWHYARGYAARLSPRVNGKRSEIRMHSVIAKTPRGMCTDHVNGDKLDNRRSNLRICTNTQNQYNRKPSHWRKYKGTEKIGDHWRARIRKNGKLYQVGNYKTEEEAALAYNKLAAEFFGEFAQLNVLTNE